MAQSTEESAGTGTGEICVGWALAVATPAAEAAAEAEAEAEIAGEDVALVVGRRADALR
ncbi:MAG: hypothetical protein ABF811_08195 [Pseudoclavibacter sp.]